jgi:hypothetical protein
VDHLRTQGTTTVRAIAAQLNERGTLTRVVRGIQRLPLGCCRDCKRYPRSTRCFPYGNTDLNRVN